MLLQPWLVTLSAVSVLASAQYPRSRPQQRAEDANVEYDYVVVGSGPGGGPLASRLAMAGHKVLLIEAGDDRGESLEQKVPALQLQSTEDETQRWDYFVQHYANETRQAQDSKMVYRKTDGELYVGKAPPSNAEPLGVLYPRAGTLGGCAGHNAMITVLPFKSDWSYLQSITGNDSWAPDHMRSYYEKLEKVQYLPNSVIGHGHKGWLTTSLTSLTLVLEDSKLLSIVLSAASAMGKTIVGGIITTVTGLGHVLLDDLNSALPTRDGTTDLYQVPIAVDADTSTRATPRNFILDTANAVQDDGSRKYHLDIRLNTLVTKIRFDQSGSTPRAVGVEYLEGHSLYAADPRFKHDEGTAGYVAAAKEVIVSTGTFNTPQLLKLSGVGPKEELEKFDIPVVKDLPGVGTNMQDRYETPVIAEAPSDFVLTKDCTFGYTQPDPCLEKWKNGKLVATKGVYASNGIAIAVTRKSSTSAEDEDPDLFIAGAPATFPGYYPGYARGAVADRHHWTWIVLKNHMRNTAGTVKLLSTDPQEKPEIVFNYFDSGTTADGADDKDLQAVYEGMLFAREAYDKLIPLDGKLTETWPGKNVSSEADVKQFIKDEAWGHHACCTAAIGADDDPMAVLDSDFRVRGIDGLRVVDASVFPKIPGYYIALPLYMVSEKAADVIINGS